jgi:hypothetical protein
MKQELGQFNELEEITSQFSKGSKEINYKY